MNRNLRLFLSGAALAATFSSRLIAADPPQQAGHVLVFQNGGILEGDIERVGDRFRIRGTVGETWVPVKGTLGAAENRESAFRLLQKHVDPHDAMDHVRLAQWCQSQGLKLLALQEAETAFAMKPGDRSIRAIRDQMKVFASQPTMTPASPVRPAAHLAVDSATIDVNPESIGLFVSKVQPILMNACARCHAGEEAGKFQLVRSASPDNPHAMHANLAAVSAMIDRQQIAASPLLMKSVTVHGAMGVPPLKDRQTAAYKHLEEWVKLACGNMPSAQPGQLAPAVIADAQPLPNRSANGFASEPDVKSASLKSKPIDPPLMPSPPPSDAPATTATKPAPVPAPVHGDPFDPAIFNQGTGPKKP